MGSPALTMLFELNRDLLEISWVIPFLAEWLARVRRRNVFSKSGLSYMISNTWLEMDIDADSGNIHSATLHGGSMGTWLSSIEEYYDINFIADALFSKSVLQGSLSVKDLESDAEIQNLPSFRRALEREECVEDSRKKEDSIERVIPITSKDAEWLIKTNFPHRMEQIRSEIIKFHDDLVSKHAARRIANKKTFRRGG